MFRIADGEDIRETHAEKILELFFSIGYERVTAEESIILDSEKFARELLMQLTSHIGEFRKYMRDSLRD